MRESLELRDRAWVLEDLVLVDACVILCSVPSKKYLKRASHVELKIFKESNDLLQRLLDSAYKHVMCYTSLIWGEVCSICGHSKMFSEENLRDLRTKMEKADKNVYQIPFTKPLVFTFSKVDFRELEGKLDAQHLSLDLNDRSLIYSCLRMGIPTIVTYDEHFFKTQILVSKQFATEELKRRGQYPDHKTNNYGVLTPRDFLACRPWEREQ